VHTSTSLSVLKKRISSYKSKYKTAAQKTKGLLLSMGCNRLSWLLKKANPSLKLEPCLRVFKALPISFLAPISEWVFSCLISYRSTVEVSLPLPPLSIFRRFSFEAVSCLIHIYSKAHFGCFPIFPVIFVFQAL